MAFAPTLALDYLRRAHDADRLGHAYLLVGDDSAMETAWQLAGMIVHAPAQAVRTHPDVHLVEPESKSRRIVIEQIRDLESSLRLRASTVGGRKVGIIREADRLVTQASNAFLKTLEEPPAASLLLLVTSQPDTLMETILSRCIKVVLKALPGSANETRTVEEKALAGLLAEYTASRAGKSAEGKVSVPAAYRLLREFTALLSAVRTRLQSEADDAMEGEKKRYSQTTDGTWLEEREDYYKALTEAKYIAERSRLVESLSIWWGDTLRQEVSSTASSDETRRRTADILRRLGVLDELRENLGRNIQEALALEIAFLQVFGS